MRRTYYNRVVFLSKSLLWSVLLYTAIVAIVDWEEMLAKLHKEQPAALVKKTEQPAAPSPSVTYEILKPAFAIWHLLVNPGKY